MEPLLTYNWKDKDYKHIQLVKSFVESFIEEILITSNNQLFEYVLAQSDRLEDFSILTICEKKISDYDHELLYKNWEKLELIYEGIDKSRNYVDKETGIELEIFFFQEEYTEPVFHIYTHTHFYEPHEGSETKLKKLRESASKLGRAFKNADQFFRTED